MIKISSPQMSELKKAIEGMGLDLNKQVRIALNATAKKSKSIVNKEIRKELANTTAKSINFTMKVTLSEKGDDLSAALTVKKTDRLSLRNFKPRQVKAGVSYQISKTSGRRVAHHAFISQKLYGGVFIRTSNRRLPILKLQGPSPWGVMTVGKKTGPSKQEMQAELDKQIARRVRFLTLKKSGAI